MCYISVNIEMVKCKRNIIEILGNQYLLISYTVIYFRTAITCFGKLSKTRYVTSKYTYFYRAIFTINMYSLMYINMVDSSLIIVI